MEDLVASVILIFLSCYCDFDSPDTPMCFRLSKVVKNSENTDTACIYLVTKFQIQTQYVAQETQMTNTVLAVIMGQKFTAQLE